MKYKHITVEILCLAKDNDSPSFPQIERFFDQYASRSIGFADYSNHPCIIYSVGFDSDMPEQMLTNILATIYERDDVIQMTYSIVCKSKNKIEEKKLTRR